MDQARTAFNHMERKGSLCLVPGRDTCGHRAHTNTFWPILTSFFLYKSFGTSRFFPTRNLVDEPDLCPLFLPVSLEGRISPNGPNNGYGRRRPRVGIGSSHSVIFLERRLDFLFLLSRTHWPEGNFWMGTERSVKGDGLWFRSSDIPQPG
ncbi:hypothetical protein LX32DRAFT_260749 [Colletotrichum zoysiae]|uniref:Uncharacterized protein n=1 Tax=Colletotrichum zoysiae TaxID=1216348 RepID=A0AAD9LUV5_9PEZI|nr:hypothetical protein LX32DRAFT_260749 [Colletotrichum zoysiae]